ncbi:MAG: imidazole glycerol phosphate synthase cyclase subunit [Planctomycetota bacterium]|nr:imidazole glycerol phosphate synthase cyclase subunit [Planctomycetota bacterium]
MHNVRIIARLDVKGENLVKGVHLEGLRKLGDPREFARRYYAQGIDEIILIDIVASLYERNSLLHLVERTTSDVFIPITVGGGLRSVLDVQKALRAGADKVAICTAALKRPELVREIAGTFGSQCMVVDIQAKRKAPGQWEAYFDNGREHSGRDVVEWARQVADLGAGEILLTSVDREGTAKGMDLELIQKVTAAVPIPVIVSGGVGSAEDFTDAVNVGKADAVAMAHVLHYNHQTVAQLREHAIARGVPVRRFDSAA